MKNDGIHTNANVAFLQVLVRYNILCKSIFDQQNGVIQYQNLCTY